MVTDTHKIPTVLLTIAIVITVSVFVYYEWRPAGDNEESEPILAVVYENVTWEYTVGDLEALDAYTGTGGMSTKSGIKGPNNFTGVRFTLLFEDIGVANVTTVEAKVIAADGYNKTFSSDIFLGNVTVYDATGNETSGNVTLVIAYEQDDAALMADDGPLQLAYVSAQPLFTSSSYWVKQVTTIEVSLSAQ
jgi:hypothetical protein